MVQSPLPVFKKEAIAPSTTSHLCQLKLGKPCRDVAIALWQDPDVGAGFIDNLTKPAFLGAQGANIRHKTNDEC
ncbi:MAG: hypothetical protein RIM23_06780 [Coleofasciculus sp. G3-WIS-01]|uniref:hypothetical protein n=1 Tax=Coleofasciculus sp. G3-WIS-01 TaxID=3069528 RepID=UPI00330078BF